MAETGSTTVGRLAPSPTGGLHLGHARTFLLAWLSARSDGGKVILRIEDIDASRVRSPAVEWALADLRWLGLDWDEGPDKGGPNGPYQQSWRMTHYDRAIEWLKARDLVYPCTCTRADIARAASAPHAEDEGPSYPGTCAGRSASDARSLQGVPYTWRFRVGPGRISWDDLFRGPVQGDPRDHGGDFLVGRSSGEPSYQLAVVVDDAEMGVNQVIRGDDLVTSTPRQILLYRAFGWPEPELGHVPLVLDREGRRLAKRDQAIKLSSMRQQSVEPHRLIARLARSLGIEGGPEESPRDLIGRFRRDRLPNEPWVCSMDGLITLGSEETSRS